jgi:phospholipid/cholesterol/gamma-HCH transport system substrate-binding protein
MQLSGRLSPAMRQSLVGLMLAAAVGGAIALALWVRNFNFGRDSFQVVIRLSSGGRIRQGTAVLLRGVDVGQVTQVETSAAGVDVTVEISPADRLIPRNSDIQVEQALFVGDAAINIMPAEPLVSENIAPPLAADCNPSLILCDGAQLAGAAPVSINALLRSLSDVSETLSDPDLLAAIESLPQLTQALTSPEVTTALRTLAEEAPETLAAVSGAGQELTALIEDFRTGDGVENINQTFDTVDAAANELRLALDTSQSEISRTLGSIRLTSDRIRRTIGGLDPILAQAETSDIIGNLENLSANAAEVSRHISELSSMIDDPGLILQLRQTLDSARSTFDNLEKISADIDELTGDPEFRRDLEDLVDGISDLVSSTDTLQEQTQYAQTTLHLHRQMAELSQQRNAAAQSLKHHRRK